MIASSHLRHHVRSVKRCHKVVSSARKGTWSLIAMIVQQSWVDHCGIVIAITLKNTSLILTKQLKIRRKVMFSSTSHATAIMRLPPSAQVQDSQSQSAEAVQLGCQGQKGHPFHQLKFILRKHLGRVCGHNFMDLDVLMRETLANGGFRPFGIHVQSCDVFFQMLQFVKPFSPLKSLRYSVHILYQHESQQLYNARVNNQTAHAAEILHFKQWPFPDRSLRVGVMMCGWYLCRLPQLLRTYEPLLIQWRYSAA